MSETHSIKGLQNMGKPFWNKRIETMPRAELDALHLSKLQDLVKYAYENTVFYKNKLDKAGVKPSDIKSIEDFKTKIPLTDKSEFIQLQQERPPYGDTLAIPPELIAHHCETSGTTGIPLAIPYSMLDTVRYGESWVYGFWGLGIRPTDTMYFAFGWGNFAGFWSAYWGARRLGCKVISGGGLDTKGHIDAILRMKPTVLISTPTFALRIAAVAKEMGVDLSKSSIKFTYHAGEPGPTALPGMKEQIETAWGAVSGELLGIAEVDAMAPGCPNGDGVHVNEMNLFTWSYDPSSNKESSPGSIGENIVSGYANTSQPLLNYRTHDLVKRVNECSCGRTWVKFQGAVLGRTDFMITVRGTNVYQTAVENILSNIKGISMHYELVLTHEEGNDVMRVNFEPTPETKEDEWGKIAKTAEETIHKSLHVRLEVIPVAVNSLPRFELKTKRIIDRRPKELRRELDR